MILISKDKIDGIEVSYYNGIDLNIAKEHPTDGSNGFMFCFVDKWVSEVKKHTRESKIDNILSGKDIDEFNMDQINNNYICIYQTGGNTKVVYEAIKSNIHNKVGRPWLAGDVIRHYSEPEMGKIPHHKIVSKKEE